VFESRIRMEKGPAKILVVDDNADNRNVLVRRLSKQGYDITQADGGRMALMAIETDTPDLVLLDHMMPDMNGLDVLRTLRTSHTVAELPVIMVTAYSAEETIVAALEAGANDYVLKPISFPVLLVRISAQLARKQAEEQFRIANRTLDQRMALRKVELDELIGELEEERARRRALEAQLAALSGPVPA
jgi:DNA-binding response OmpR family regulator